MSKLQVPMRSGQRTHGRTGGARLVRRTLVALDYEHDADTSELAALLGVSDDDVAAWLLQGKKELGIPVSIDDLHERAVRRLP